MKILAVLTPAAGKTPDDFRPHIVAEEAALWPMYREGLVREMHFQPEPLTVALTFEAAGKPDVEAALGRLPMVRAGLLDVRLVALGPWLPLEALFRDGAVPPAGSLAGHGQDAATRLIRGFYAAVEAGDETSLRRVLSPEWEESPPAYPGQPPGPGGYLPVVRGFRAAFPDGRFEIHEIIAAGPKYTVRSTVHGTHRGPFLGREATGKTVSMNAIDVHEVVDDSIHRSWHIEDFATALAQMDA